MPLIGIDPNEVVEADILGAKVRIGVPPSGIWQRIRARLSNAYDSASRRVLPRLVEEGLDPEEVLLTTPSGKPLTRLFFAAESDPRLREELVAIYSDALRWTLRGHSDFLKRDGSPVPFETEEVDFEGRKFSVPTRDVLRWYEGTFELLLGVFLKAKSFAELGTLEKKA